MSEIYDVIILGQVLPVWRRGCMQEEAGSMF